MATRTATYLSTVGADRPKSSDPERLIQKRDQLALASIEILFGLTGAGAGAAMGILAGPVGIVVGAAMGALIGGIVGHQVEVERHELDLHYNELDDIDAEYEFYRRSHPPVYVTG